jgi:hypothetical protein
LSGNTANDHKIGFTVVIIIARSEKILRKVSPIYVFNRKIRRAQKNKLTLTVSSITEKAKIVFTVAVFSADSGRK